MAVFAAFHHYEDPSRLGRVPLRRRLGLGRPSGFATPEAAAWHHLTRLHARRAGPPMRLTSGRADAELVDVQAAPLGANQVVRFRQTHRGVAVFGSRITVELTARNDLVAIDSQTAAPRQVPKARLDRGEALERLMRAGAEPVSDSAPELVLFGLPDGTFRAAYFVRDVAGLDLGLDGKRVAQQLDSLMPDLYHCVVDAYDGELLLTYAAHPMLDLPAVCRGVDDAGVRRQFNGCASLGGYLMSDPDRAVATWDLEYADYQTAAASGDPV